MNQRAARTTMASKPPRLFVVLTLLIGTVELVQIQISLFIERGETVAERHLSLAPTRTEQATRTRDERINSTSATFPPSNYVRLDSDCLPALSISFPPRVKRLPVGPTTTCAYYTNIRQDRSGATVLDMLLGHAFSFSHGVRYGGACGESEYMLQHKSMVDALGLTNELPFACPHNTSTGYILTNPSLYRMQEEKNLVYIMNLKWREYIQKVVYDTIGDEKTARQYSSNSEPTIAVHIRRGDVAPCMHGGIYSNRRTLPNQHYLDILQQYETRNSTVKIFSEKKSFESLDVYFDRGYEVILSGPPEEAWREFLQADVLIMARSSFSMVPGILTKHKVVYTPGWLDHPLKYWDVVNETIMNRTEVLRQELLANCSKEMKRLGRKTFWDTQKFYEY